MPSILGIALSIGAAYLLSFVYCFIRNFFLARKTGFPSIYIPWDQNHFLWMVVSIPLRPQLQKFLPRFLYNRIVLTIYGWEFHEKLRPFTEYSRPRGNDKSYMLVTCGKPEFETRDAEIAALVLAQPRDFQQVDIAALFMAKFGRNVLTANGDHWARQRKVVASVINERISKATFDESVRQTEGLVDEVSQNAAAGGEEAETNRLFDMMKKITIRVLSGAGMGASIPWNDEAAEKPKPGFEMNYIEAVKTLVQNLTGPIILPSWFLLGYPSSLPGYQTMRSLGIAVKEFPAHTMDMLDSERQRSLTSKNGESRSNIMSQLLQAAAAKDGKALSDEEMMGNLFIFTAAGFDTTANTLSYAMVLLARYPLWQEWLFEEIDLIAPNTETTSAELEYGEVHPKAVRILAFMLETLRLFPPVIHIAKETKAEQTIETSSGKYWFPANTTVYINVVALHLDPAVFRNLNCSSTQTKSDEDEMHFRPTRWLKPSEGGAPQQIYQPPKGAFLPWSAGPRVCPGQKMAQVEFTAVVLTLLRRCRIEAVPLVGETELQVNVRLDAVMKKSMSALTLQMEDVYDVGEREDRGLKLRLCKRR